MESEEKAKAKELIWDVLPLINGWESQEKTDLAKKIAVKTVDQIIDACEYNHVESWNTDWWNRVKEEIINYKS